MQVNLKYTTSSLIYMYLKTIYMSMIFDYMQKVSDYIQPVGNPSAKFLLLFKLIRELLFLI